MDRRELLRLAGVSALAGVTGCTGDGDDDEQPDQSPTASSTRTSSATPPATATATATAAATATPAPTPSPTPTTIPTPTAIPQSVQGDRVEAHALDAVDHYQSAFETMQTQFEIAIQDQQYSYDPESVRFSINEGDADLERAADDSDGEFAQVVGYVRTYGDFAKSTNKAFDDVISSLSDANRGNQFLSGGRYDDAQSSFSTAADSAGKAEIHFKTASEAVTALREGALQDDEVTAERLSSFLDDLIAYTVALGALATGFTTYAEGTAVVTEGDRHYQNEQFREAADDYSDGANLLTDAAATFQSEEDVEAYGIASRLISAECFASTSADGANHYATACNAVADGDRREAQEAFNEGDRAFRQLNNC